MESNKVAIGARRWESNGQRDAGRIPSIIDDPVNRIQKRRSMFFSLFAYFHSAWKADQVQDLLEDRAKNRNNMNVHSIDLATEKPLRKWRNRVQTEKSMQNRRDKGKSSCKRYHVEKIGPLAQREKATNAQRVRRRDETNGGEKSKQPK